METGRVQSSPQAIPSHAELIIGDATARCWPRAESRGADPFVANDNAIGPVFHDHRWSRSVV
jgi:hypothetical protein